MSYLISLVETGEALSDLVRDQAEWSQATFGTDKERGPIGPLKHLEKEAKEAYEAFQGAPTGHEIEEELADCFLLILDASRRFGMRPLSLIRAAQKKMEINKARKWPQAASDEPVLHVKE